MSESSSRKDRDFNPLSAWLGFPADALPRDYYSLLGLAPYESDPREINRAAETLIAHVREIRPGPYLAEWTQLLDILRAAKACLCDPDSKRAYDEALRSRRINSLLPGSWLSPQASPGKGVPREGDTASTSPMSETPHLFGKAERPFESPAAHPETIQLGLPRTPIRRRKSSSILARIFALGLLILSLILAHQMVTAPERWRPRLYSLIDAFSSKAEKTNPSPSPLAHAVGTVSEKKAGEIASTGGLTRPEETRPLEGNSTKPTNNTPLSGSELVHSSEPVETPGRTEHPVMPTPQTSSMPAPSKSTDEQGGVNPPLVSPSRELPGESTTQPQEQQGTHESEQNGTTPAGEPPRNEAPSNQGLRPQFRDVIDQLWRAMSQRELEIARATLNRLAADVRNESERQAVESLDYLLRHLEEFWHALARIVPSMKAGEELAIGDTYIVVVDATADELVLRAEGQNRRYRILEMPTPLIRLIVARRFRPGPETDAAFGAFLAVDPRGNPREAEELWRRADDEVLDADVLFEALKLRPSNLNN